MEQQSDAVVPAVGPTPGIRGWLVLPAIGMVLGPILGLVSVSTGLVYFEGVEALGYGGLYASELVVEFLFTAFMVYVAVQFFRKKREAPRLIITLLVAQLGVGVLLIAVESAAGADIFVAESAKSLVRGAIAAAIWIPYFKVSKQVAVTFVN